MDMKDIAEQAQRVLGTDNQRTSAKQFSIAEQQALIAEQPVGGGRARNSDRLDITGTHYEALDAEEEDDSLWF